MVPCVRSATTVALDRLIAGPDDPQGRIALRVARDRLLRHEECGGVDRLGESRRHEHARKQERLRVGEAGAERHRAGRLVDDDLAELDRAGEAIIGAVGELQPDLRGGRRPRRPGPAPGAASSRSDADCWMSTIDRDRAG